MTGSVGIVDDTVGGSGTMAGACPPAAGLPLVGGGAVWKGCKVHPDAASKASSTNNRDGRRMGYLGAGLSGPCAQQIKADS
jgi:hypothetical protein